MGTMKIRVLKDIPNSKTGSVKKGHKVGQVIEVETKTGIPTSRYWRDRLKDSAIDGCCEIVKQQKSTSKSGGEK